MYRGRLPHQRTAKLQSRTAPSFASYWDRTPVACMSMSCMTALWVKAARTLGVDLGSLEGLPSYRPVPAASQQSHRDMTRPVVNTVFSGGSDGFCISADRMGGEYDMPLRLSCRASPAPVRKSRSWTARPPVERGLSLPPVPLLLEPSSGVGRREER